MHSQTLEAPAIRDILRRSIDTFFVMARVTLKVTNPRTFILAFELLSGRGFNVRRENIVPRSSVFRSCQGTFPHNCSMFAATYGCAVKIQLAFTS